MTFEWDENKIPKIKEFMTEFLLNMQQEFFLMQNELKLWISNIRMNRKKDIM